MAALGSTSAVVQLAAATTPPANGRTREEPEGRRARYLVGPLQLHPFPAAADGGGLRVRAAGYCGAGVPCGVRPCAGGRSRSAREAGEGGALLVQQRLAARLRGAAVELCPHRLGSLPAVRTPEGRGSRLCFEFVCKYKHSCV